MDLIDFMQPLAILACFFCGFVLIFQQRRKRLRKGHYTLPDWNFFLKKWWAARTIEKIKTKHRPRELKDYSTEEPKILSNENSSDSQLVYGSDTEGNSLLVKFTRRRHHIAEVWLILRLRNHSVFTLPDHPDTKIFNANSQRFTGSGLSVECLVPFSRWRITFTGMLRKGIRNRWEPNINDDELVFVKFHFIWAAGADPIHWPHDWSTQLMATSLATEPWRDGRWMHQLSMTDSGGYDQYGSMMGQIFLYSKEDSAEVMSILNETIELNLPGLRQRRWGPHKVAHLHRTASIIGVCSDGMIFLIGANSSKEGLTHSQFGNIRVPNGSVYPIDWTDFRLSNIAEHPESIPKALTVRFSANGKNYAILMHFRVDSKIGLVGGRPVDWSANIISLELGVNGLRGVGVAMLWYPYVLQRENEQLPTEDLKIRQLFHSHSKPSHDEFVLPFTDENASSLFISGGKGASLVLLTSVVRMITEPDKYEQEILKSKWPDDNFFRRKLLEGQSFSKSACDLSTSLKMNTPTGILKNKNIIEVLKETSIDWKPKEDLKCPHFTVPIGFILSVSAFDFQLNKNPDTDELIQIVESICYEKTTGSLQEACERASRGILEMQLAEEIETAIGTALENLKKLLTDENPRFAVRSSAIGEDGEDMSAAGQNETFLGLRDLKNITSAVKKCWASLYKFQSVEYRRQHIQPIKTGMAVVIQEMVPPDCAGVLFTRYPVDGNPSKILITANYGLGESVVSGEIDPDVFVVKRNYSDNQFDIVDKKIGNKTYKIIMTAENGVTSIELDNNSKNSSCLNNETILKLAEIGVALEKMYGNPRDIEWAVKNDEIYLVQSRPITSLNAFSDWELLHEFDSAVMSIEDCRTTANLQEVTCGCTTPLSLSTVFTRLDAILWKNVTKRQKSDLYLASLHCNHYQLTLDVTSTFLRQQEKEISLTNKTLALAILGHEFITPELHSIGIHRYGIVSRLAKVQMIILYAHKIWQNESASKKGTTVTNSFKSQYSKKNLAHFKSAQSLYEDINSHWDVLTKITVIHSYTTQVSVFCQLISMAILTEGSKDLNVDHHSDIALILSSCKDVESADIPKRLDEIVTSIFDSGKADDFTKINFEDGLSWLKENCPESHQLLANFINKNFHRAIKELDLVTETWGMNPNIILKMIQTTIKLKQETKLMTNSKSTLSDQEIIDRLKSPKKNSTRKFLSKLLILSKKSVQRRETSKSNMTSVLHEFRMAYRHLGQMMVWEGYLPEKGLIFFLTNHEIKTVLTTRNASLINKAVRRRKAFPQWEKVQFPEISLGLPKPISTKSKRLTIDQDGVLKIIGTTVCGGVVTGRACVIRNFSDISLIKPGDILVTHSTDIGWSPYFPILGGVVTELGGLISHGAVVAREYGLPCIVAAHGVTEFLNLGDIVTLDACQGIVFKENN